MAISTPFIDVGFGVGAATVAVVIGTVVGVEVGGDVGAAEGAVVAVEGGLVGITSLLLIATDVGAIATVGAVVEVELAGADLPPQPVREALRTAIATIALSARLPVILILLLWCGYVAAA